MKFRSGRQFLDAPHRNILLMGPSGAGKTSAARRLERDSWIYYVDYRIWTHYLGRELNHYLVRRAMADPVLAGLLRSDAIVLSHNITAGNLLASSVFMGMLGSPATGGTSLEDFKRRMATYRQAEIAAMLDAPGFMGHATATLGYEHFTIDASGSLCHMVDVNDPDDPLLRLIEDQFVVVDITCSRRHKQLLLEAAASDPKPIFYPDSFLDLELPGLLDHFGAAEVEEIHHEAVGRYLYPRLIAERQRLYQGLAARQGYTIPMDRLAEATTEAAVLQAIADAIDEQATSGRLITAR